MEVKGIEIAVTRKKIKHLRLTIHPPMGTVKISAPHFVSEAEINAFALSKADWIQKQVARIQSLPPPSQPQYRTGETHFLWGQPCSLVLLPAPGGSGAVLRGNTLLLSAPQDADIPGRALLLNAWYRTQLAPALPPLFAKWEPILGVHAAEVRIKNMKTRWGTCNTREKRVWINLQLVRYPPACLEYVVVHELVHLLEPSHNRRFITLMGRFLPDWKERKQALRTETYSVMLSPQEK